MEIFDKKKVRAVLNLVADARQICIVTHRSPDGDAIGSALAMRAYLLAKGKRADVLIPDKMPDNLDWIPGSERVLVYDRSRIACEESLLSANLVFVLDFNAPHRAGDLGRMLPVAGVPHVMIDHHENPETIAEFTFSQPDACSTAQMVFEFIAAAGDDMLIDKDIATCLYTGMVTDTGSFRYPSVTEKTHIIAARLLAVGIDHGSIHNNLSDNNRLDKLKLTGFALSERLELLASNTGALIWLSLSDLTRFNYTHGDTEGLVNQALSLKGVEVAAFFRETAEEVKCSFRSLGHFDCNEFARSHFNGGGHKNAAGGSHPLPIADAVAKFKSVLDASLVSNESLPD